MKTYAVYAPNGQAAHSQAGADSLVFVKEGFTWLAFLLPLPWLLWYRAWLGLALWVAGVLVIGILTWFRLGATSEFLVSVLVGLMMGFEAAWFRALSLRRRGYEVIGVAAGDSLADAEQSFFARWLSGKPAAPRTPVAPTAFSRIPAQPVLGFPQPEGQRR